MRTALSLLAAFALNSAVSTAARGHLVWMDVVQEGAARQVEVYFSETADPGEPHLIEKIAATKVSVHTDSSTPAPTISLKPERDELSGKLIGPAPHAKNYCLEAICDYGIVAKGGQPFLLQYYAQHIHGDPKQSLPQVGGSARAPLAIQVNPTAAGFAGTVVWNGMPLANAEVLVHFPEGDTIERRTDDRGQIDVATKTKGQFALRTRHVEPGKSGQREGKKYAEIRHYATLTLALTADTSNGTAGARPTAAALLRSAREARAVWGNFPGFSADLAVRYNEETVKGKVTITSDGDVVLAMPKFTGAEWLQTYLESVVQHRMPGDPESENVRYVDEGRDNALGRKIALGDGDQDSVYRLAGDVVREVNRKAGPGRFTISVLDVEHNAEGKYLPRFYTMTFWNGQGKVTSTSVTQDSWIRLGRFDLPLRTMQVTTTDDRREVKLLEFSNHALADQKKAAE
jgi:hypothetical protein